MKTWVAISMWSDSPPVYIYIYMCVCVCEHMVHGLIFRDMINRSIDVGQVRYWSALSKHEFHWNARTPLIVFIFIIKYDHGLLRIWSTETGASLNHIDNECLNKFYWNARTPLVVSTYINI